MPKSARLLTPKARITVQDVPIPQPEEGEIVIAIHAAASNPVDYKIQHLGIFIEEQYYPIVLGVDVAGVVESVGAAVTRFKKGDRVLSFVPVFSKKNASFGGFQEYTRTLEQSTTKIPDSLSFDEAATIPLAIATAAEGLYQDLKLTRPSATNKPVPQNEVLLVWGGSSSVGLLAIQLAVRSGYKVISTASKHNHDYVKSVGAAEVFDYNDPDVVAKIKNAAGGPIRNAFDAISESGSAEKAAEVLEEGGSLALVLHNDPKTDKKVNVHHSYAGKVHAPGYEFAHWLFVEYLEEALKQSQIVPNKVQVVPGWIDGVQNLLDKHAKGVSGVKLIVHKEH